MRTGLRILTSAVFAAGLIPIVLWQIDDAKKSPNTVMRARNFYGLVSVRELSTAKTQRKFVELRNGHVKHGKQYVSDDPAVRRQLTSYVLHRANGRRASDSLLSIAP